MMNGSITQFPDEKSEVEKEQELVRGHWVTLLELGQALGLSRWVHALSVPSLSFPVPGSDTFHQLNPTGHLHSPTPTATP